MTNETEQLRASLTKMLAAHYDFAARKRTLASPRGWSRELWDRYAELGLTAIGLPEEHGGIGGAEELAVVFEALGRALALEPLLDSTVLAGTALARAASAAQAARLLPQVADGSLRLALALGVAQAAPEGDSWRLTGRAQDVLHGDSAELLLVGASLPGGAPGLFLVAPDAPGLLCRRGRLQGGTRIADLSLDAVPAEKLDGNAATAIAAAQQAGLAALLAFCVGAMEAALALTVDYLKTRQQFGRPIGSNQALQHRAADMLVALEEARSMAALAAESHDPGDLSRARIIVARCGRFVGQQAVQLHGGIGMTEEYAVGHYLRALTVANQMFGDTELHLARLAKALEV